MNGFTRYFSPPRIYLALEALLLILVAVQGARLFWAIVTPAGPLGEVRAPLAGAEPSPDFDPFFRLNAQPGTAVVTSLALKLYGVRVDEAMGGGSAIIATPDGQQSSFGTGDEIMPGVKLKSVAFDSVTIERNGASEQLFLDQSVGAPVAAPASSGPPTVPAATSPGTAGLPPSLQNEIGYAPRFSGDKVTGITVTPRGSGQLLQAAGLLPGDVVTSVNGQPATSPEAVAGQVASGNPVTLQVERAGRKVTVTPGAPR